VTDHPADDPFAVVRAGYDRIGDRYRAWSSGGAVRLRQVDRLLDRLPAGSVVVDLGCGPGEPATRLLAERHHVVAIDASRTQLLLAKTAAPTALLVQADMTRLHLKPESVDAVAAFYSLGHVPARRHAGLLREIATWLRPGGVLLASTPLGAGDDVDQSWLGVPMFFGGIGADATRDAVTGAGLSLESFDRITEDEGDGHLVEFAWVVATKAGSAGQ
jgi:SAM-dependent methyltransferase